ncbi:MAG: glycosyltransferase [Candidatus Gottesmanbacteria bacterium]
MITDDFDRPDSLLVISSYPERGVKYSGKVCAVGGFVKNTIDAINSSSGGLMVGKIIVLTISLGKEELYKEDGILIWRIFKRNNPFSYLHLWKAINRFKRTKNVLLEFEFASFGDTLTTLFFPLTLVWLRLLGKTPFLVIHQVVPNLNEIYGHLGWKNKGIKNKFFDLGLKAFYWILLLFCEKAIVLEKVLKERLVDQVGWAQKIQVIPHGVDKQQRIIDKQQARTLLRIKNDELICLYFGYLTWYKGVDLLIKAFSLPDIKINNRSVKLIIAGGESFTQSNKIHYKKFVKGIYNSLKKTKNILITGFVEEKKIPLYFSAADLVILPYRTFMSSSGPLSLACSFNKPFILSSALEDYVKSADFALSLAETGLNKEEILFSCSDKRFIKKLTDSFNKDKMGKLIKFSKNLAQKRDFKVIALEYIRLLSQSKAKSVNPISSYEVIKVVSSNN